jgi:hypothetical protein
VRFGGVFCGERSCAVPPVPPADATPVDATAGDVHQVHVYIVSSDESGEEGKDPEFAIGISDTDEKDCHESIEENRVEHETGEMKQEKEREERGRDGLRREARGVEEDEEDWDEGEGERDEDRYREERRENGSIAMI